jgi:HAD superfamily hydrolase (TIGR01509 family)
MGRYKAVLLDVDGTLVDSNELHALGWQHALGDKGYVVPLERVRPLVGMGGDKIVPALTGLPAGSPEAQEIAAYRTGVFEQVYAGDIRPFPRVRELLARLKSEGYDLIVATSAKPEEFQPLLAKAGVTDLIDGAASAGDAERSKPDPDIVKAALAKAGVPAKSAVLLGDTPYDIAAAHKAGVAAIGLRSGGRSDGDLEGALAVYDDPADLLARFASSPLSAR